MHEANVGKQFELFHGTTHPFEVGDIVKPRLSSSGRREAFAGSDAELAYNYAVNKSKSGETGRGRKISGAKGAEPRVYKVEPLDPEEKLTGHGYPEGFFVSRRGFKVVGRMR